MIRVIQSWDDGVVDDIRLVEICRKHGARASFNLNPGLHGLVRGRGWKYGSKEVLRLARGELEEVYRGFEVANHSMTHPHPDSLPREKFAEEIRDARKCLQDWFGQPIDGFCYPYGTCSDEAQLYVEETGHRFARRSEHLGDLTVSPQFRLVSPHGHFTAPDFWPLYDAAKASGDYFFFWGHSYELVGEPMWSNFESIISRISNDPDARWATIGEFVSSRTF